MADEEQIEGPAAAEVGHDDGVDGHGGEEPAPRSLEFLERRTDESPCGLTVQLSVDLYGCVFMSMCMQVCVLSK